MLGRLEEAEVLLGKILSLRREIQGERHPATTNASNDLANFYRPQAKTLRVSREILGKLDPTTINVLIRLTEIYKPVEERPILLVYLPKQVAASLLP